MSLQFIIGRAGSGKSTLLYKNLIDTSMNNPDKNILAVVPEQFSMETQKQILTMINEEYGLGGSFNIEVTSLNRLAYLIFEEQGIINYKVMDDLGKSLVIRKVLEQCKKELIIYKNKTAMPGFVEKVKSVLSELKQYYISDTDMDNMLDLCGRRPALYHKLKDILVIRKAFDEYIQDKMITTEDVLEIFCKYVGQSEIIKNTYFYFDSFTGFTPIQYKVLELLMKYSKGVMVSITLPENEKDFTTFNKYELFSLSKETIAKLKTLAKRNNVNINETLIAGEGKVPYRIKNNKALCHIEENIFRNKKLEKTENYNDAIEIYSLPNPRSEVAFVVAKISDLIVNKNYRYNDIAIITGDMANYYIYLEEELKKYDIPAFIDHKRDISSNPFVDGIIAVLDVIAMDFSYDAVMRMLRLNLLEINRNDIDVFENYIRRFGRRGFKSYSAKWEKCYKGFEERLVTVNNVREKIYNDILALRTTLKDKKATIKDFTLALYNFILSTNMEKRINDYVDMFEKDNKPELSKEYQQIYGVIILMIERIVDLMGEETVSPKEYVEILKAGFLEAKVGIIPPGLDTLMVGDIERTRLKDTKKIIFFLGVNDGIIPKMATNGGIITDSDRDFLKADEKEGFVLAPTDRENIFKQKVYLYSLLAKPTEKIILTLSKTDNAGKTLRKSYLISDLQKMFSDLKIKDEEKYANSLEEITTKREALDYIAANAGEYKSGKEDRLFEVLCSVLSDDADAKKCLKLIKKGTFYKGRQPYLSRENARKLYEDKENIGITRLEKYAACAYSQFLRNGLKLGERREYEIAAYDIGNLYHEVINKFFVNVQKEGLHWENLEKETYNAILNNCVVDTMENYENDALDSSARNIFIKNQVRETAEKTIDVLIRHIDSGDFVPSEYELRITHGRIDRVDTYEKNNEIFVKVIDYKSGTTEFNVTDTFFGMQMQLMVYLKDAIEFEKKKNPDKTVLPGAGLYFHIQNPYIDRPDIRKVREEYRKKGTKETVSDEKLMEEKVQDEQYKCYRMSGLVNSDFNVIEAIDKELSQATGNSKIIKVGTTKTGLSSRSTVIESNNYMKFINHVYDMAENMRKDIIDGNIQINPTENACTYCPYGGVCGFDLKVGDRYRQLEKLDLKQVISRLNTEENKGE